MASLSSSAIANHTPSPAAFAPPKRISSFSNQCRALLLPHRSPISRMGLVSGLQRKKTHIFASVTANTRVETSPETVQLPRGDSWSVHKFGGTCVGSSERINNVANIILGDESERKFVIVSAMSKVTDMMYDLIYKAQSRDESYLAALDAVLVKHRSTAVDLLDGDELASFLSALNQDICNLKAMLRAIYIAGHATESFTDLATSAKDNCFNED